MRLKQFKVHISFPGGGPGISGTWKPDQHEREAAWEMYIELVTRVTAVELEPGEGLLREALTSYYSLFATTRQILREHGPVVALPKGSSADRLSFGEIAVAILNEVVRPLLANWHPRLLHYEAQRLSSMSPFEHERAWVEGAELRRQMNEVRETLVMYAELLAQIARVTPLTRQPTLIASS